MKLRMSVIAVALAFPLWAQAQTADQFQQQIDQLKTQIKELQELVKGKGVAATVQEQEAPPAVDLEDFNRIKTKVEAMEDQAITNGTKGLRISGGIDPVYMYNQAQGSSSFSFGNNSNPNGFSYDDSSFGLAYIDFQKEMEGGTKLRLTLMPTKSAGAGAQYQPITSSSNGSSIIHEASASIPLTDAQNRLLVGQIVDVSGYEPVYNTYAGANNITSNQLYPGYAEYFITKNMLYDFTAATTYTGAGLDLIRDNGYWEFKFWLANLNSARNYTSNIVSNNNIISVVSNTQQTPAFIYNVTYAEQEFWGYEFTGYHAMVYNAKNVNYGWLDQFEIDGNYTRGTFNGNLQFTAGQLQNAGTNGGNLNWWGISALAAQNITPRLNLAARVDYLYNQDNGGGTWLTAGGGGNDPLNGVGTAGDGSSDGNTGANRTALSVAATYRLNPNVAFRGEVRHDMSSVNSFLNFSDGSYQQYNNTVAVQTIVNF